YKFESFELFSKAIEKINKEVLSFLFKGALPSQNVANVLQAKEQKREKVQLTKEEFQERTQTHQTQEKHAVETFVRTERKIGRNEQVTVKNVLTGENKSMKYKQAMPLLEQGKWIVVED
ncbi:MAG: preprotein translocase subunit SecA, partial [Flavobacteriaceae bacterium]|nr:preprotein translocase subunit SecA [Flavobacteriaceae bacterium]